MPFNTPGFQLGSLWLLDIDQRNHPYLLDCYYTSRPHTSTDNTRDATAVPFEAAEQQHSRDYWMPSNLTQNEARYDEELWGSQLPGQISLSFGGFYVCPILPGKCASTS
jgi:autophagy-related protein 9